MMTVKDAAAFLRVKPATVQHWHRIGKLEALHVPGGRKLLFDPEKLRKMLCPVKQ